MPRKRAGRSSTSRVPRKRFPRPRLLMHRIKSIEDLLKQSMLLTGVLTPREQFVIRAKDLFAMKLSHLAKHLKVSRELTSRLRRTAIRKLNAAYEQDWDKSVSEIWEKYFPGKEPWRGAGR